MTEVLLKPKKYGANETYNIMCESRKNIQVWTEVTEKPRMSQNCGRHTVRKSVSIQASPIKRTFERRPKMDFLKIHC